MEVAILAYAAILEEGAVRRWVGGPSGLAGAPTRATGERELVKISGLGSMMPPGEGDIIASSEVNRGRFGAGRRD
jgi:hypothetical protein